MLKEMRQWSGMLVAVLVVSLAAGIPSLLAVSSQRFPASLWPTSDAGFDLGIGGPDEGTQLRWNRAYFASSVMIGATQAMSWGPEIILRRAHTAEQAGRGGPGQGMVSIYVRRGGSAGTCRLVAVAGTTSTETVIADNIGSGCN